MSNKINVDAHRYLMVPLSQLVPAPWNYKMTGDEIESAKGRLRAAMESRGQILNLVVRELGAGDDDRMVYEVANGNHRLELLQEDGAEAAMCYNLGPVDQATAEVVALETNGEYIKEDPMKVGKLLQHAAETIPMEQLIATLPMSPVVVDHYVRGLDLTPDPREEKNDDDEAPPESNRCMIGMTLPRELGEEFKAQLKRFETDAQAIQLCVTYLKGVVV